MEYSSKTENGSTDFMIILSVNETIERREDGHVLRKALDFEVEGQRMKEILKRTWKRQVEEESMKVGLRRKDALCCSVWSVGVNKIAFGLR